MQVEIDFSIDDPGRVIILDPGLYTPEGEKEFIEIHGGREPDMHEMNVVNNGTAILEAWAEIRSWDLTPVGGPSKGFVYTWGFQEIDIEAQEANFMWDPLDHIDITESHIELGVGLPVWGDGLTPKTRWDFLCVSSSSQHWYLR